MRCWSRKWENDENSRKVCRKKKEKDLRHATTIDIKYIIYSTVAQNLQCKYCLKPIFHCDTKPYALGCGVGLDPQRHNFALPIPTCWYLKMLKFAFSPKANLKFALPLMRTPNASQWNIGCVGSPTQNFHVGHVHCRLFVSISYALFAVEYGLNGRLKPLTNV